MSAQTPRPPAVAALSRLEDNLPSGAVFRLAGDPGGRLRFEYLSAGVAAVAGVAAADALADPDAFFGRVHPDDRPRLAAAFAEPADLAVEVRVTGPAGEVRWAEVRSRPAADGGRTVWDGFLADTTDRKRAEQILTAENHLSALLADLPPEETLWHPLLAAVGGALGWEAGECWRLDPDTGRLRRAAAWCRPAPELERFVADSDGWAFPAGDGLPGLAWQAGEPVWMPDLAGEPFFHRKDLAKRAGLGCGVGVPVRAGGACVGVVALFSRPPGQDYQAMRAFVRGVGFTLSRYLEHRRAEAAVQEARDAAERANRAKDVFLATVSHELRTPLAGVLGMTELALADAADPRQAERLTTVRRSAEGLLRLVNALLDVARIEAGGLDLRAVPFDPREVLASAVAPLAELGRRKGVTVGCHTDPAVPARAVGDPDRLR